MTLRVKIFLYFILPVLCAITAISLYDSQSDFLVHKKLSDEAFVADTQNAAAVISKGNTEGITLVTSTASVLGTSLFGNRTASVAYMKDMLAKFRNFSGCSVSYEPNADFNDMKAYKSLIELRDSPEKLSKNFFDSYDFKNNPTSESIENWVENTQNGRFLCYWKRKNDRLEMEPLVGMESSEYYSGIKNKFLTSNEIGPLITQPNIYNNSVLTVEYAYPIIVDDRFAGEVAFDRNLNYIADMLEKYKSTKDAVFFLISDQNKIISCTKDMSICTASVDDLYTNKDNDTFNTSFLQSKNGKLVRDESVSAQTDFSRFSTLYRDILRNVTKNEYKAANVSFFADEKANSEYAVSFVPIRPSNWVLAQIAPKNSLYADLNDTFINSFLEIAAGFAIFLFTLLFSNGFISKIKNATTAAESLAAGKTAVAIKEVPPSRDETAKLNNAMYLLASRIAALVKETKNANYRLLESAEKITSASTEYGESVRNFGAAMGEIDRNSDQMEKSAKDIFENVSSLSQTTKASALTTQSGKKQIRNAAEFSDSLVGAAKIVGERIDLIKDRAKKAQLVLERIDKIAAQSNLLSITAAIEAEKSEGKSGEFLRIAREISRLAKLTNGESKSAAMIIDDMMSAANVSKEETAKLGDDISKAARQVLDSFVLFEKTAVAIDDIIPELGKIRDSISSQSLKASQLKGSISAMIKSSNQSSALLAQFLEMRRELNFAVEKITYEISKFSTKE